MYEVSCKEGAYAIPTEICVGCGGPVGASHGVLKVSGSDSRMKRFLTMKFPLCEECDSVRERVNTARKPRKRYFRRVAALPVLALGAVIVLPNISGFGNLWAWVGLAVCLGLVWLVLYRVLARIFRDRGHGAADQDDRARLKAIESSAKIRWSWGKWVFGFANPAYGFTFEKANLFTVKKHAA